MVRTMECPKYGEISHIAGGARITVNKEGEFIPRCRIENAAYEEDTESDTEDTSESSDDSESTYESSSESDAESEDEASHFERESEI